MKHTSKLGVAISLFGIIPAASAAGNDVASATINNTFFLPLWFIVVLAALAIFVTSLSIIQPPDAGLPLSILGAFLSISALFSSFIAGTAGEIQTITTQTAAEVVGNITTVTYTTQMIAPVIMQQTPGILLILGGIAAFAFIVLIGRIFAYITLIANNADTETEY